MDIYYRLRKIAAAKQEVTIIYNGGSQPGTKRRIVPIMVAMTQMRALDLSTNQTKTFSLDKIEIVDEDHAGPDYQKSKARDSNRPIVRRTLVGALENELEEFKQSGWQVRRAEESIKLYLSSGGKLEEHATVGIRRNYNEVIRITAHIHEDTISTSDSTESVPSRDRPWYVFGPTYLQCLVEPEPEAGQSYKYLNKAVSVFLDEARRYAPNAAVKPRRP